MNTGWNINAEGEYLYEGGRVPAALREAVRSVVFADGVTRISPQAFVWCINLTSVTIPASIVSVGSDAFAGCARLASVTFSGGPEIEDRAFEGCVALVSISIPNAVTKMGISVFKRCAALTSASIGTGVTELPYGTFQECPLLSTVNLPAGMTSIGAYAFAGCTSYTVSALPTSLTHVGHSAFLNTAFFNDSENWVNGVLIAGNQRIIVAGSRELTTLQIKAANIVIADNAFAGCTKLESVTYTSATNLVTIGSQAFSNCINLRAFEVPESVRTIGDMAFMDCIQLATITIPDTVQFIGAAVLDNTAYFNTLSNWKIRNFGTRVKLGLFVGKHLISLTDHAREYALLTSAKDWTETDTLTVSAESGFFTPVKHLTILETTEVLGDAAFAYCYSLEDGEIPDSVVHIGDMAFCGCANLKELTIGDGVTHIGDDAFYGCSKDLVITTANTYVQTYCTAHGITWEIPEVDAEDNEQ